MGDVRLARTGPVSLAGLPVVAPFEELSTLVPEAWRELRRRLTEGRPTRAGVGGEVGHRTGAFYGVFPASDQLGGPPERYTYVVAAQIDPAASPPAGLDRVDLPAVEHAVVTACGGPEAIPAAYRRFHAWIAERGRRIDPNGRGFERYETERCDPFSFGDGGARTFDYDIFLPLAPDSR